MRSNMGIETASSNVVAFPATARAAERLRERRQAVERPVIYDGAWYHEEAVAEDRAAAAERRTRKDH